MSTVFFSCHVEPLKKSRDISYFDDFITTVGRLHCDVILLFMVGEEVEDEILSIVKSKINKLPSNCRIGLHVHGRKTAHAIKIYQKIFRCLPEFISFGHWVYNENDLEIARKCGVKTDLSFAAYRHNLKYFFKNPYTHNGLEEFPVSCNPIYPINPFYTWYDFFLAVFLLIMNRFFNKPLHLTFHSYDLYPLVISKRMRLFVIAKLV